MPQGTPRSNLYAVDEERLLEDISQHLQIVYPDSYEDITRRVLSLLRKYYPTSYIEKAEKWTQSDVLLITYGDSVIEPDVAPLETLLKFLDTYCRKHITGVHILPFYPYSSDDGFSVIDYRLVNPALGDWAHISAIAAKYRMMVDLVINHVSRESLWFYDFVSDRKPACDYFIELSKDTDLSKVTRPRDTPVLTPVNTHKGMRYLWATFSEDQIDLDFSNPDVLLDMLDIFLFYLANGARLIRLDAIAFLWKRVGTNCIHLEETHEIVKLLRDILEHLYHDCILLTETNVPHHENMSYFGNGDEANMVYQFALPPLALHALNRGTSEHLTEWAKSLEEIPEGCTYFNFTASHDGIGLRALEGMLPEREINDLIDSMHRFGGFVSMKSNPDGKDSPYEINISYFDAMQGTRRGPDQWHIQRFICSQAIMLALKGLPAIYLHSLVATPNDLRGVELTGRTRSINRKTWNYTELSELLDSPHTPNSEVLNELLHIIDIRRSQTCFNPDNEQQVIDVNKGIFAFLRLNKSTGKKLFAIHNVTMSPQLITVQNRPDLSDNTRWHDLLTNETISDILPLVSLSPYQIMWLVEKD